jgi:ferritin-like metal-binding protein YciE
MAAYGTAKAFAKALDEDKVVDLLQATLDEEGAANEKLTSISSTVNIDALHADSEANVIA